MTVGVIHYVIHRWAMRWRPFMTSRNNCRSFLLLFFLLALPSAAVCHQGSWNAQDRTVVYAHLWVRMRNSSTSVFADPIPRHDVRFHGNFFSLTLNPILKVENIPHHLMAVIERVLKHWLGCHIQVLMNEAHSAVISRCQCHWKPFVWWPMLPLRNQRVRLILDLLKFSKAAMTWNVITTFWKIMTTRTMFRVPRLLMKNIQFVAVWGG